MNLAQPDNATQDVFELVLARPVAWPDLQHARLVHVQWWAPDQGERLVQLYANGELTASSSSPTQREAWLLTETNGHVQIELLAVRPEDVRTPWPEALAGVEPVVHVDASLTLLRDVALPPDAAVSIRVDEQIDIDTIALFDAHTPRAGYGSVFGTGGFGYDAATGLGLGLGELGYGPLGIDGDALRWRDNSLARGDHTVYVSLLDREGNPAASELERAVSIARLPEPAGDVVLSPDLQLTWT